MKLGSLKPFQKSATEKVLTITRQFNPDLGSACLLIGKPGSGKTFIAGEVIEQILPLLEEKHPYFPLSNIKILYVTAAAVVTKTKRDLERFNIDPRYVKVTSYSSIIANDGKAFWNKTYPEDYDPNDEELVERLGKIPPSFEWIPFMCPRVIILDESQRTRKDSSAAYRCLKGATHLKDIIFILMSGTPFQSVMEAEIFARAANVRGCRGAQSFYDIAINITGGIDPYSYSTIAMQRLMKEVDHLIVRIPNIRTKYKNHLKIQLVDFLNEEEKAEYDRAFEDYIKECIARRKNTNFGRKAKLVSQNKFRQRAEIIKARLLANHMHDQRKQGYAPMVACEYQTTIVKAVIILINEFGYKRDDIAIIWGGGSKFTALKRQYTSEEIYSLFTKALVAPDSLTESEKDDIDEINKQIEQTGMNLVDELQDPTLRLGPQSDQQRDEEISRFQSGKANMAFFTFKAGSVGLSLHHCVDYFEMQPEVYMPRKGTQPEDMDWVYRSTGESVPYKPCPRRVMVSPTWNAIEWVQAIGRAHRLTSLSDTIQCGIYYRGTIEEKVAMIAAPKLKSLAVVAASKDAWMDAIDEIELEGLLGQGEIGGGTKTLQELISDELIELEQEGEER